MLELFGALIAGVLTTLAPCVLPLLPIIVGGSIAGALAEERADDATGSVAVGTATVQVVQRRSAVSRALVITASLGVSILVFTLALKATTALIGIPPQAWQWVSGGVLIALGLVGAFPDLWERLSARLGLQARSAQRLGAARRRDGVPGEVLTGAALGPVFTSCSPLYGYVIVTVLPAEPVRGLVLLGVYILGLCATLLLVALAGQRVVVRFGWAADSHGWFRRGLGLVFIVVGVLVATGAMKSLEAWLVVNAPFAPWNLDSRFIG
jgi:cytochrome c biogenesis protein CcdA